MSNAASNLRGTVLVTGAAGFIGSHVTARLIREHAAIRCLQRPGERDAYPGCERCDGDIRDAAFVHAAMEGVSTVLHLAGIASVGDAQAAPQDAFNVNTLGVQNIVEAARVAGARSVVMLSTAHVYGRPASLPLSERHAYAPASIYAATKLAGDILALGYYRSFGLPVTILRPFNVYGPGQPAVAVIPEMIAQAAAGGPIRVRNPRPQRDFTFVGDIVEALLLSVTCEAAAGEEIILGSGSAVSIGSVARRIEQICSRSENSADKARVPDDVAPQDAGSSEEDCLFADVTKAHQVLNWRAATSLDTGLARTIAWWREHMAAVKEQTGGL